MNNIFRKLSEPFPLNVVSWRAQSLTQNGDKALALAYIDARDVMDRLDSVVGPAGWQNKYSHANGKTVCDIGIKIDGEWVWKADGAGDSDVEAEKGALSDAFKRAAVRWGIGRYLYEFGNTYVPCETYESNGKKRWKRWIGNPWDFVNKETKEIATPQEPCITKEQEMILMDWVAATDTKLENLLAAIKIDSLAKMNQQQYDWAIAKLKKKAETK